MNLVVHYLYFLCYTFRLWALEPTLSLNNTALVKPYNRIIAGSHMQHDYVALIDIYFTLDALFIMRFKEKNPSLLYVNINSKQN